MHRELLDRRRRKRPQQADGRAKRRGKTTRSKVAYEGLRRLLAKHWRPHDGQLKFGLPWWRVAKLLAREANFARRFASIQRQAVTLFKTRKRKRFFVLTAWPRSARRHRGPRQKGRQRLRSPRSAAPGPGSRCRQERHCCSTRHRPAAAAQACSRPAPPLRGSSPPCSPRRCCAGLK